MPGPDGRRRAESLQETHSMTGQFWSAGAHTYSPELRKVQARSFVDPFRGMIAEAKVPFQDPLVSSLVDLEAVLLKPKLPAAKLQKIRVSDREPSEFFPKWWRLTFRGAWRMQEHIGVLKARTAVRLRNPRRRTAAGRGPRTLAFIYDQAVLRVVGKCRRSVVPAPATEVEHEARGASLPLASS